MNTMNITIFAKKRTTSEGKKFYSYLTTLTRKNGDSVVVTVKFNEACGNPRPEDCPMNIIVDKATANLSGKTVKNTDTGEVFESRTLWVKNWEKDPNVWVDTSLDDFE